MERTIRVSEIISSDVSTFTKALLNSKAYDELPFLKGDFTSNWDIMYRGEFKGIKAKDGAQHQLLSAEKTFLH